jgi:hypothetical protein
MNVSRIIERARICCAGDIEISLNKRSYVLAITTELSVMVALAICPAAGDDRIVSATLTMIAIRTISITRHLTVPDIPYETGLMRSPG